MAASLNFGTGKYIYGWFGHDIPEEVQRSVKRMKLGPKLREQFLGEQRLAKMKSLWHDPDCNL